MYFNEIAKLMQKIESTKSRVEIRELIKDFLKKSEDVELIVNLLESKIFKPYENIELNVGESLIIDGISISFGCKREYVKDKYNILGDLGILAYELSDIKKQSILFTKKLSIKDVYQTLIDIAKKQGKDSSKEKIKLISSLFSNTNNLEAKLIAKILNNTLRNNIGTQTIIEALTIYVLEQENIVDYKKNMNRFREVKDLIEEKYNITYDLGILSKIIINEGLLGISKIYAKIGIPIRSALAEREKDFESILKRFNECLVEAKYDGFRVQIHKKNDFIKIFSRAGEDITNYFPEIKNDLSNFNEEVIFDAEAIGFDYNKNKYLNFQETIKRKRKYDTNKASVEIPIIIHIFDVMLYQGKDIMNEKLSYRRKICEELVKKINLKYVKISEGIITNNISDMTKFFNKVLDENLEGIIIKDLNKRYIPGKRDFAWIKMKKNYFDKEFDSYDLIIVGYNLGKGKYANKPSTIIGASYSKDSDEIIVVTKIGSGLQEKTIEYFEDIFKDKTIKKPNNLITNGYSIDYFVEPKIVIEVVADEITKTDKGLSLRFPRLIKIRDDKNIEDATTIEELNRMYSLKL